MNFSKAAFAAGRKAMIDEYPSAAKYAIQRVRETTLTPVLVLAMRDGQVQELEVDAKGRSETAKLTGTATHAAIVLPGGCVVPTDISSCFFTAGVTTASTSEVFDAEGNEVFR